MAAWEPAWEPTLLTGPVWCLLLTQVHSVAMHVKRRGTSTPQQHAPRMSGTERCAAPRDPKGALDHVWCRSPGTRTCCWRASSTHVWTRASRVRFCAADREGGPGLASGARSPLQQLNKDLSCFPQGLVERPVCHVPIRPRCAAVYPFGKGGKGGRG